MQGIILEQSLPQKPAITPDVEDAQDQDFLRTCCRARQLLQVAPRENGAPKPSANSSSQVSPKQLPQNPSAVNGAVKFPRETRDRTIGPSTQGSRNAEAGSHKHRHIVMQKKTHGPSDSEHKRVDLLTEDLEDGAGSVSKVQQDDGKSTGGPQSKPSSQMFEATTAPKIKSSQIFEEGEASRTQHSNANKWLNPADGEDTSAMKTNKMLDSRKANGDFSGIQAKSHKFSMFGWRSGPKEDEKEHHVRIDIRHSTET